jgi:Autophagocytosis associated protein, active-site domain
MRNNNNKNGAADGGAASVANCDEQIGCCQQEEQQELTVGDDAEHVEGAGTLVGDFSSTLYADDDCVTDQHTTVVGRRNNDQCNNAENIMHQHQTRMILWVYSIVYSPTWRAPVLYFTAEETSSLSDCQEGDDDDDDTAGVAGCGPLSRRQVLQELEATDEEWNFISSEEHPLTGLPSFFLHPCQTAECLSTIIAPSSTSPAGHVDDDQQEWTIVPVAHRLWAWCALVFPAAGLAIPPMTYVAVRDHLEQQLQRRRRR